jgi:hypothetical protein
MTHKQNDHVSKILADFYNSMTQPVTDYKIRSLFDKLTETLTIRYIELYI